MNRVTVFANFLAIAHLQNPSTKPRYKVLQINTGDRLEQIADETDIVSRLAR